MLAAHREKADLIAIGAYQAGGDPVVDEAVAKREAIDDFLRQRPDDYVVGRGGRPRAAGHGRHRPARRPDPLDELAVAALAPAAVAPGPSAIPPLDLSRI